MLWFCDDFRENIHSELLDIGSETQKQPLEKAVIQLQPLS